MWRPIFPYWKLVCARPLPALVPQQLHAVAELPPPGRMNELPHPHHPSALPWQRAYIWTAALPLLNHISSPIVQVVN